MDGNRLTDDWLETGLARLEEEGLSASTLHQYRGYLRLFQQFLGQTKELGPKSLAQWQQAMAQEGVLSNSSINTRISAGNSLLRALGHPEWQVPKRLPEDTSDLLDDMIRWPDNQDTNIWYYLAVQEATNSHDYERKSDGVHEKWTALNENEDWVKYQ